MDVQEHSSDTVAHVLEEESNINIIRKNGRKNKILKLHNSSVQNIVPKLSCDKNGIDLSVEENDSSWITDKFPNIIRKKQPSALPTVRNHVQLRKDMKHKIVAKTKAALQKRQAIYKEDNKSLLEESDEEEFECDDEDSGDDGDEEEEEEKEEDDEEEHVVETTEKIADVCQSNDNDNVDNSNNVVTSLEGTSQSTNLSNKTESSQSMFPRSLSQWYHTEEKDNGLVTKTSTSEEMEIVSPECVDDELLLLCSGQFEAFPVKPQDSASNLAAITMMDTPATSSQSADNFESDEDDDQIIRKSSRKEPSTGIADEENESAEVVRNVLLNSDDESSDDEQENKEHSEDEKDENQDSEFGNEELDSDDELALFRKQTVSGENFIDDEASLSGDDVGSDIDEDDLQNEYEKEEGDDDNSIDMDEIRMENHRQFMRHENAVEHRELVRLKERLMTDGDLGGTSTNRSFRVRLREEVDVEVENEDDNTMDGKDDEELDEINARRTEVIKFKLSCDEKVVEEVLTENVDELDMLESAATAALIASAPVTTDRTIPSLLNKASLTDSLKDNNGIQAKSVYTNISLNGTHKRSHNTDIPSAKRSKTILLGLLND